MIVILWETWLNGSLPKARDRVGAKGYCVTSLGEGKRAVEHSKVCIFGGTGFVGHFLARRLARAGIRTLVPSRHPQRHADLSLIPNLELARVDIFDSKQMESACRDCDAVVNLIGILNERGSTENFERLHIEVVEKILETCQALGIERYLHMSALQADTTQGASAYLRTKGAGEERALGAERIGIRVTSFRPSVIFGEGDSFFNRFAGLLALAPGGLFPLACPEARFAPVYAGDVAEAMVRSLDNPETFGRVYELCGPRVFSLRELVAYTAQQSGKKVRLIGLGDSLSRLQARILGLLPGKPFSMDNYLSLQTPSLCHENGLVQLGVQPTDVEIVVPIYLGRQTERQRYTSLRKAA